MEQGERTLPGWVYGILGLVLIATAAWIWLSVQPGGFFLAPFVMYPIAIAFCCMGAMCLLTPFRSYRANLLIRLIAVPLLPILVYMRLFLVFYMPALAFVLLMAATNVLIIAAQNIGLLQGLKSEAVSYLTLTLASSLFILGGARLTDSLSWLGGHRARYPKMMGLLQYQNLRIAPYLVLIPLYVVSNLDKLSDGHVWMLPFSRDALVEAMLTTVAIDAAWRAVQERLGRHAERQ